MMALLFGGNGDPDLSKETYRDFFVAVGLEKEFERLSAREVVEVVHEVVWACKDEASE